MKKTAPKKTRAVKTKKVVSRVTKTESNFFDFKKDNLMVLAALVVILAAGMFFLVLR